MANEIILTEEQYVERDGLCCPVCKGRDISFPNGSMDADLDTTLIYVPIKCDDCGSMWTDIFTLTGYTKLVVNKTGG